MAAAGREQRQQTDGQPDVHAAAAADSRVVRLDRLPRQQQRSGSAATVHSETQQATARRRLAAEGSTTKKNTCMHSDEENEEQRAKPRQSVAGCQQRD